MDRFEAASLTIQFKAQMSDGTKEYYKDVATMKKVVEFLKARPKKEAAEETEEKAEEKE